MSDKIQNSKRIELPTSLTVREFAQVINTSPINVIRTLMSNGVMANINQQIDFDTAAIVAAEMGFDAVPETPLVVEKDLGEVPQWRQVIAEEDEAKLQVRPPVVAILGHVDHGKTSLLDAIRQTNVAGGEVGGITQHIGAYQADLNGRLITFLDTPGHSAFTAMRARGAQGADIVVLVVAADDGVQPQTREAAAHAKAARVPIIVAMNKMDKPNADPDRVKQQLAEIDLVPDDWDGDIIVVPLSAKQRTGIEDLLEAILLVADNNEILANPDGQFVGTVIESKVDKSSGVLATILVQNGSVNVGDVLIVGTSYGKLKAMFDYRGKRVRSAGPSMPVSVMGLNEVPTSGELVELASSDKEAKQIILERIQTLETAKAERKSGVTLEELFDRFQAGDVRELRLIIKADVQGSLEPIINSLREIKVQDININILHSETGNITDSDVMLASASSAIVLGFSVQADVAARRLAEAEGVSIRIYDIIYRLLEDVEKALKGMLEPEVKEVVIGRAEVRDIFRISKVGNIAGCRVVEGEVRRNAKARLYREKDLVYEGEISSLKHLQDDVREVRTGFECGINLKNFNEFEIGDIIESYVLEKVHPL
jgi:translation initiation factor IF-2